MKKKWNLVMVIAMLATISGCGNNEEKSKETVVPTQTVEVTQGLDSQSQAPTIESTKEPTDAPSVKPPESTVVPTIKPTESAEAPTVKPTEPTVTPTPKPTKAPVATTKPTQKPAKKYTYLWYDGPAEMFEESELPPDKYPVPEGYSGWTNKIFIEGKGEVWEAEYKKDELAYNSDGTLNIKNCVVYWANDEFLKVFLQSEEVKSYLNKIGVTNVTEIYSWKWKETNDARSFEYSIHCEDDYKGGFFYIYLDKNYKVTEENPFE